MAQEDQVQAAQPQPAETTSGEGTAAGEAAALSPEERAELEQLRAWRESQRQEMQPMAAEGPEEAAPVGTTPEAGPEEAAPVSTTPETGPEDDGEPPYGTHQCPECEATVAVQYPGYDDPFVGEREVICENGHRFFPKSTTRAR